jgi:RNA polymerase sporulation-specific sigma factor
MIIGEIKRFLRDDGPVKVSRSIRELYYKARSIEENLKIELGRPPSVGEIALKLNVDVYELNTAYEALQPIESIYSTVGGDDKNETYLVDKIGNIERQQMRSIENYNNSFGEGAYERIIDKMSLSDVIDTLSHDERQVIKLRYFKNLTQSNIAGLMGISQVQVSRIEKRVLLKMREMLG